MIYTDFSKPPHDVYLVTYQAQKKYTHRTFGQMTVRMYTDLPTGQHHSQGSLLQEGMRTKVHTGLQRLLEALRPQRVHASLQHTLCPGSRLTPQRTCIGII